MTDEQTMRLTGVVILALQGVSKKTGNYYGWVELFVGINGKKLQVSVPEAINLEEVLPFDTQDYTNNLGLTTLVVIPHHRGNFIDYELVAVE